MNVQIEFDDAFEVVKTVPLEQFIRYFKHAAGGEYQGAKQVNLKYVLHMDCFVCRFRYAETFERSWIKFLEDQANAKIDKLLEHDE